MNTADGMQAMLHNTPAGTTHAVGDERRSDQHYGSEQHIGIVFSQEQRLSRTATHIDIGAGGREHDY